MTGPTFIIIFLNGDISYISGQQAKRADFVCLFRWEYVYAAQSSKWLTWPSARNIKHFIIGVILLQSQWNIGIMFLQNYMGSVDCIDIPHRPVANK